MTPEQLDQIITDAEKVMRHGPAHLTAFKWFRDWKAGLAGEILEPLNAAQQGQAYIVAPAPGFSPTREEFCTNCKKALYDGDPRQRFENLSLCSPCADRLKKAWWES